MLAHFPAFQNLSPVLLDNINRAAASIAARQREIIYEQGASATGLYIVTSGHVKLYRQSRERTQILALLKPGDCFGADTSINEMPSPYAVSAITDLEALHIPPVELMNLITNEPEFRMIVLDLVSIRLRQFAGLVHGLAFRDVAARLASIIVSRAKADGKQTPAGLAIPRLLTQSELAAMAGTAREVVYRTFKKFEQSGLLTVSRDTILVLDLERLEKIAQEETR